VDGVTDSDNLRIGTAERESAVKILSDHMSEGRLSLEEYEERMTAALAAKTRGELRELFTDLPAPYPAFMVPPTVPPPGPVSVFMPPAPPAHESGQSDRNQVAAGVLQILLPFGIGRFYTGHTQIALAQLLTSFMLVGVIWSIIDGIMLLVNGGTDADGRRLRSS
jgi:TM2 domain-containing membrane protein YozV